MPARRRRQSSATPQSGAEVGTTSATGTGRGNAARVGNDAGRSDGFSLGGDLSAMASAMGVGDGLLGQGDRGAAVISLQRALGMEPWQQDGIFGRQTRAALVAFQRSAGLGADGLVGPETMAALQVRSAPTPATPTPATPTPATPTPATSPEGPQPRTIGTSEERLAALDAAANVRAVTSGSQMLRSGSEGPAVIEAQKLLGMEGAALNGTYDAAMAARVRQFQQEQGIAADGVLGPSTMSLLLRSGTSREIESGTIYEPGDVGPGVLALQRALGMSEAGQTGDFGPTTREMLLEWQAKNGIQQTGRVGPTTWKALKGDTFMGSPGAGTAGYDPAVGQALARASVRLNGGNRYSNSECYKYVADAVDMVIGKFLTGRHAYMAASQLAAKPDLFTEVPASGLSSLPAGAIVVWGKGNTKSGHISIALGDGQESSDFVGEQMLTHYGGAGARVFLPKGRS